MRLQSIFRRSWLIVSALGLVLSLQGCLDDDFYDANKFLEADLVTIKEYIETNNLTGIQLDTLNSIYYQLHTAGTGYKTVKGVEVTLHYQGETLEGREFVNTFGGLPQRINLGVTRENSAANPPAYAWGLDSWLLAKAKQGDSLTVFLPSPYAFQEEGFAAVGPNTPVKYRVKFVDIALLNQEIGQIDDYVTNKGWTSEIDPVFGTRYVIHQPGDGGVTIEYGNFISIHYRGSLMNETQFDSNYDKTPWNFTMGQINVIPGFEIGLSLLNEGDSATFFVPSIYGYGKNGTGTIPANAVLRFDISVRDVVKQ